MILFVQENCHFCDDLGGIPNLLTVRIFQSPGGWKADVDGNLVDPRQWNLRALPTLVIGSDVYEGAEVIKHALQSRGYLSESQVLV
jgi:hypothetical protein